MSVFKGEKYTYLVEVFTEFPQTFDNSIQGLFKDF